jgi:hypothetical protein
MDHSPTFLLRIISVLDYYGSQYASVAEWSIALDCKSGAFGLRRFESFPAHQNKNCFSAVFVLVARSNLRGRLRVGFEALLQIFCEYHETKYRKKVLTLSSPGLPSSILTPPPYRVQNRPKQTNRSSLFSH